MSPPRVPSPHLERYDNFADRPQLHNCLEVLQGQAGLLFSVLLIPVEKKSDTAIGRRYAATFGTVRTELMLQNSSECRKLRQPRPPLSPRSLENLKNVKGVTWSHGPSMESPRLEVGAKNHSSRNLRLLLKRSWNRLSYSRSTHLSGTPSNTTNVL